MKLGRMGKWNGGDGKRKRKREREREVEGLTGSIWTTKR